MSSSSAESRSLGGSAQTVPINKILQQRYGRRSSITREEVAELSESLATLGQLSPVIVVADGEHYRLVAGARRVAAASFLGWEELQAVVWEGTDVQEASVALAENVARDSMNPLDEARCLRELMDFEGMSMSEAGRRLGRSMTWIRARLQILDFPEELQIAVGSGRMAVSVANELVAVEDDDYRAFLVEHAMVSGISAEQARRWVGDWRSSQMARSARELEEIGWTPPESVPKIQHKCGMCEGTFDWEDTFAMYVCTECGQNLQRAKRGEV